MSDEVSEDRVKRWLGEAEGYLDLELYSLANDRLQDARRAKHWPYECQMLLGRYHRDQNRYQEGVPCFERALILKPGDITATVGLGWCLKRVGKVDVAAQAYEAALKHHPQDGLLHYNLACYQSLLGLSSPALKSLNKAIKLDDHFRNLAHDEIDFEPIRELPQFKKVLSDPKGDESTADA